ncbi:MAG: tRNA glutamyl-Q(34) synthetase GluQRS [Acidobacteria bacterium]|nr:tRNA glutamyl-Q(34) synthetase GluQRS [Acidobacteriota bacterium]
MLNPEAPYRGRIAPSPTGYLHLGHARTFLIARERARKYNGELVLRNEDLDPDRCRREFVSAMLEDLVWLGLNWDEGPDRAGPYGPYSQSERREHYLTAWRKLRDAGFLYPCSCSRKELAASASAPHEEDDEPIYPGRCRDRTDAKEFDEPAGVNWRFQVPDGEEITFADEHLGPQHFLAGRDFGDFVVWRRDDVPAYQLAVVVDDHAMRISEVVRGRDLVKSTARQWLIYRAFNWHAPSFYHCDLVRDEAGARLAKRDDSLSIRKLRADGWTAEELRERLGTDERLRAFLEGLKNGFEIRRIARG